MIICLLLILFGSEAAMGASDFKYNKKATEKVWSTRADLFDPSAEVSDSVRQGASAAILADYYNITANREYYSTPQSVTNRTRRVRWNRRMVKLFDAKAVEEFSEHEFGNRVRLAVDWFTFGGSDNAFGARIHKPDGRLIDVDIKEAVAVLEGKKGKEKDAVSRKIAIPGLEPGDVLEYFDYTEEWLDDLDLPDVRIIPFDDYPVSKLVIEGDFSPELTVEYRAYNGFHNPERILNDKGRNRINLELFNIGTLSDKRYISSSRQLPFLRLSTLNNTSDYRYYPASVRRGGLYGNIAPGTIYRDIKYTLANVTYDDGLQKKVRKIMGDFCKLNPEVKGHELVDAYWLAGEYVNATDDKGGYSDYGMAVMMSDLINKLGISDKEAMVGFVNSRESAPTKEVMSWHQPDFGMVIGDTIYMEKGNLGFIPGQLPGEYQGEEGAFFPGDRKLYTDRTMPLPFMISLSKSHENKFDVNGVVSLDPGRNIAKVRIDALASGASKAVTNGLTDKIEWAEAVENYLGIPEKQRFKDKKYDAEARKEKLGEVKEKMAEMILCKGAVTDELEVAQRGVVPGQENIKFTMSATVEECINEAGDEILFNIGKFVGDNVRLDGSQRDRQLDAYMFAPHQLSHDLRFELPAGYSIDKNSLDALQVAVNNKVGSYHATASVNDAGELELRVRERYKTNFIPLDQWQEVLDILDASAAYNDAVVVLKKD